MEKASSSTASRQPVRLRMEPSTCAEAANSPLYKVVAQEETTQESDIAKIPPGDNVPENIVAGLMAEDSRISSGVIFWMVCPTHHALGVAKASSPHHGGELGAGLHQNMRSGGCFMLPFSTIFSSWRLEQVGLGERLVVKRRGLNVGRNKQAEQRMGM